MAWPGGLKMWSWLSASLGMVPGQGSLPLHGHIPKINVPVHFFFRTWRSALLRYPSGSVLGMLKAQPHWRGGKSELGQDTSQGAKE